MKKTRFLIPSLLAFAAFSGSSYAALLKIGVSFMGRDGAPTVGVDESAGALPQQDWNNLGNNTDGITGNFYDPAFNNLTSSALFADNGIAGTRGTSTVTMSLTTNDAWHSDGGAGTANERLMKGIVKTTVNNTLTLTLNNLTVGTNYKLLVYTSVNNAGSAGNLGLIGASTYSSYYVTETNVFDGTFTLGNSTDIGARSAGADYSQWDSVQSDATGHLTFTAFSVPSNGDGFGISGFQLIEIAPVSTGDVFWNVGAGAAMLDTAAMNWRMTNDTGASEAAFATNNAVHFGNMGASGARTVTVHAGGVTPGNIEVNNESGNDYTISGGALLGLGVLTKDGAGSLTLLGANEFGGNVALKHGTTTVATIGDAAVAGNLGKGGLITIGDATGASDAILNYGGNTATYSRELAVGATGATVNITSPGQSLTLQNLSGAGSLAKGGDGGIGFDGLASTFTGEIALTGGSLSVRSISSGAGSIALSAGTAFNFTGSTSVTDARMLALSGAASVGVADPAGNYAFNSATSITPVLTKTGDGRLELGGTVSLTQLPVISAGTLALTKEGAVTFPAGTVEIAAGARLEVVPSVLGAANPVNLNGGALRVGHQGLQAYYFTGGYNQGDWLNQMNSSAYSIANSFAALGAPAVIARTNTGGKTDLNFSNAFGGDAPFGSQGLVDIDNIRAVFAGKIRIDNAGITTFYTRSDDGSGVFIDGQRVVLNNNLQGDTSRQGDLTLSAGLHDIMMYFYEGGGGAGFLPEYKPVGGVRQVIPNSMLFAGDSVDYTATTVNVTAPSFVESGASSAQIGALALPANTLLTLNGSVNFASATLAGGAHQVAVTGFNANSNLGALSAATTLTKTGNGNLIFTSAPIAGTSIASNEGLVVAMGSGGIDPLAGATLAFNGGGLGLSSTGGNITYNKVASSAANLTIAAGAFGNSNTAATTVTYSPATLVAPAGNTLTLRTNNDNYTLNVTSQITGSGNIVTEEGAHINLLGGANNSGGDFTNKIAVVNVSGNLTTNALVQEGNLNSLGNNLVAGQLYGGSLTTAGTTNSQSLSVLAGGFVNSGTMTVATSAVFSGGSAEINGVLTAGSLTLNGSGVLNIRNDVTVTGVTTVDSGRTLNFDMGANTRTYTGEVTVQNQSTLRGASGVTNFGSNAITVQPRNFASGLIESLNDIAGGADQAFVLGQGRVGQPTTGGLQNGFRLGNDNTVNSTTLWGDNDLWVYTGQFYDADGQFSFAEDVDDQVRVRIDGILVLGNDQWDYAANTNSANNNNANINGVGVPQPNTGNNYGMGPEGNGWHNIEVRMFNGAGGAGPGGGNNGGGANWTTAKGFVFSPTGDSGLDANNFSILTDPGNSTVLRTVSGGGYITVEAGATIMAGSTTGAQRLQLNGGAAPAVFQLNNNASTTTSSADGVILNGTNASGSLLLGDNNTFNVGQLIVPDNGSITIDEAPLAVGGGILKLTGVFPGTPGTTPSLIATGSVNVNGGTLIVNAPVLGSGTITAALSGTIGGSGAIAGPVVANSGGKIAPGGVADSGVELAILGTGNFTLNTGATLALDITDSLSCDSVNVTGSLTLGGSLQVALLHFAGTVGEIYYIMNNDAEEAVIGTFDGLADGGTYTNLAGAQFQVSYDAVNGGAFDTGGNDVALKLLVVPEPGTVSALLGGLGVLFGMTRSRRRRE